MYGKTFDLFGDLPPEWEKEWKDMPEFIQHDCKPSSTINIQFATEDDRRNFLTMLGEKTNRQKSLWWPSQKYLLQSERIAEPREVPVNKYPVYIISKGRWESRHTADALDMLCLPYHIVVEPQEYDHYASVISREKILTLPFSNLGWGSIPARNWVWEHSIDKGHKRHWILDDNIAGFYRLNRNLKRKIVNENPFMPCERFTDRYDNVPMSGLNYEFFCDRRAHIPPYYLNTRIYSCILLSNEERYSRFRWRGRYNEDTDLSLRFLKAGFCTILLNAYLAKKLPTMTVKGGNTDELYRQGENFNGRLEMAKSLKEQHPDVVRITKKWGRWQHHVDYRHFKSNKLERIKL